MMSNLVSRNYLAGSYNCMMIHFRYIPATRKSPRNLHLYTTQEDLDYNWGHCLGLLCIDLPAPHISKKHNLRQVPAAINLKKAILKKLATRTINNFS
jgi:hypothetical protein